MIETLFLKTLKSEFLGDIDLVPPIGFLCYWYFTKGVFACSALASEHFNSHVISVGGTKSIPLLAFQLSFLANKLHCNTEERLCQLFSNSNLIVSNAKEMQKKCLPYSCFLKILNFFNYHAILN